MKPGAFARALDLSETTVRNYVDRTAKPSSDVLERISNTFKQVNLVWLVTGQEEPFLTNAGEPFIIYQKNNLGQQIGTNHGTATQHSYTITDCEKERDSFKAERDLARAELVLLRQQLTMAQALIDSKDETITLLRGSYNRPN